MMGRDEFYTLLSKHDWLHDYSDDHSVWKKGHEEWGRIVATVNAQPEFRGLLVAFSEWVKRGTSCGDWSGKPVLN